MAKKQKTTPSKIIAGLSNAQGILQELASQLGWMFSRKNYMDYGRYCELKERQLEREEREYLRALKRRKAIETKKIGKRLMVRLTQKGWNEALRNRIKTTRVKNKNGFCFIIFDVPEQEREARDVLRLFLKECGFIRLQYSVWFTDRDVIEPLQQLLQRKNLEHWVRIIVGNIITSSIKDKLLVHFNYKS